MFRRSALIVSTALVLALPAGPALASIDDVDEQTVPTVACDQYQERAQLRDAAGAGECPAGEDGVQTMTRQREQVRDQAECTGDGPQARGGSGGGAQGQGPGDGSGPLEKGSMNGSGNQFGRAGR